MRRRVLNFTVELPPGWCDITGELPGRAPPTMAKRKGVGALQFSQGEFEEPLDERLTASDLLEMVKGIARGADSAIAFDERAEITGPVALGAVSLAIDGNFVRVWGVSDGREVIIATYTCGWRDREREVDECDRLVQTIRIVPRLVGVA